MNRLNVVSTHSNTAQLIRLEATRMGFLTTVSDTPIDGFSAYAVDCDTCPLLPPSPDAPLLLLSREEPPEQHAARATVLLPLPLALDELRAALARLASAPHAVTPPLERPESKRLRRSAVGIRLKVDAENKTVSVAGNAPVRLSDTEFALFLLLYENKSRPVSFKDAAAILGAENPNKYNVYICYLRRKLEAGHLRLIHTVRGKGYALKINGKDDPQ